MTTIDKHSTLTAHNIIAAYRSAFQSVHGHDLTYCEHSGGRWFRVDGEMRDREWMIREIQRLRQLALEQEAQRAEAQEANPKRSRLMKIIGKLSGRDKSDHATATDDQDETLMVNPMLEDTRAQLEQAQQRDIYFFGANDTLLLTIGGETLAFKHFDHILLGRDPNFPGRNIDLTPYQGLEKGVSRRHAQISYVPESDSIEIMDGSSANGTYINGQMLNPLQPYRLYNDDTLHLGALEIHVRFVRGK